jgi:phosphatidylglycerophosphatase C
MDRRIAAFDFDGTLTRRDTVLPFLVRVHGKAKVARAMARVAPAAARARLAPRPGQPHHRDLTKAAVLRELFSGEDPARLADQGEAYAQTLTKRLRPDMVRQLAWHVEAGHELVIVSASLAAYLVPFAAAHDFDHVIGVELETGPDGLLTGALIGENVRGPEKATRLRAWFGDEQPVQMWAYGNSSGDRELLAMATNPVWVTNRRTRRSPNGSTPI